MPSLPPDTERNDGREANRLEEEREHKHGDARIPPLCDRSTAECDDAG